MEVCSTGLGLQHDSQDAEDSSDGCRYRLGHLLPSSPSPAFCTIDKIPALGFFDAASLASFRVLSNVFALLFWQFECQLFCLSSIFSSASLMGPVGA
jgi:hypothetical protein